MVSAVLSLQRGLRGMFPGSKSLSAVAVILGLAAFVIKLAAAIRDSPGSFDFIPAEVEARLLALDVNFAHSMLFTAIQLGAVMVLIRRCSGRHAGRFTGKIRATTAKKIECHEFWLTNFCITCLLDVLYALFGLLQLYLLTLSRVWNTPLFLIFGLQIDLLCEYLNQPLSLKIEDCVD